LRSTDGKPTLSRAAIARKKFPATLGSPWPR
jgi:hypothetical protein